MKFCATAFRITCHLFCLIGCAYQVFHVTKLYFEYHSVIDTSHHLPITIKLPTVSLCFETSLVFNDSAISLYKFSEDLARNIEAIKHNDSLDNISKELKIYSLKREFVKATSAQELEYVTKSFRSLVDNCKILSPQNDIQRYIECDSISEIDTYYHHIFKCFTMFSPKLNTNYSQAIQLDPTQAVAEKLLTISTNFQNTIQLYLDSNNEHLVGDQDNWITIDFMYYRFVQVWYSKTTRRLLPTPYETNCKNFSVDGYVSRQDCIRQCMIEIFEDENDLWPRAVPCPSNITLRRDYKLGKKIVNIEKHCIMRCKNKDDCYRETFSIRESQCVLREENSLTSSIELLVQKGLEKVFILHPKLDIFEYYSYIPSIISLWYEISVIAFTHNKYVKQLHVKLNIIADGQ